MSIAVPVRANRVSIPSGLLGDERLARAVGTGDEQAFATLFARYHQPLYRYCRSLVLNDEDAQDALQATMTGALVALRRAQRDAPLKPWLYRIAHNESISLLRRRRPTDELGETLASPGGSPEHQFAASERLGMLVADLQELPERQRGALVMRELSGLSHEEIAGALEVSLSAAKQTIFEARRGLLEFAEGRAMACEDILRVISDGDGRTLRGRRVTAHLRDCQSCAAFAAAIPARKTQLMAIAPPIAPFAAICMITRLLGAGSGHSGGSAGGVAVAAAGKSAGAVLAAKALAGVAIVATAAAGATGALTPAHHPATRSAHPATSAARSHPSAALAASAHRARVARRHHHRVGPLPGLLAPATVVSGNAALPLLAPATPPSATPVPGYPAAGGAATNPAGLHPGRASGTPATPTRPRPGTTTVPSPGSPPQVAASRPQPASTIAGTVAPAGSPPTQSPSTAPVAPAASGQSTRPLPGSAVPAPRRSTP